MRAWPIARPPKKPTLSVKFETLRKEWPPLERLRKDWHANARVLGGPCGLGELEQFAIVLPDYIIKVVSADKGYQLIFWRSNKRKEQRYIYLLKRPSFLWFDPNDWVSREKLLLSSVWRGIEHGHVWPSSLHPALLRGPQTKMAEITSCTSSLIDPCVVPPKCVATHLSTFVIRSPVVRQPSRSWTQRSCDKLRKDLSLCLPILLRGVPQTNYDLWSRTLKRQRPDKCWRYFFKTFKDCVDILKCYLQPDGEDKISNDGGLPVKRPCRSRATHRASHV